MTRKERQDATEWRNLKAQFGSEEARNATLQVMAKAVDAPKRQRQREAKAYWNHPENH